MAIMGTNRRTYARQTGDGDFDVTRGEESTVTVVLVGGAVGDYAAYIGMGSPEFVAKHGDKLSFAEACHHFPGGLEEGRYRA